MNEKILSTARAFRGQHQPKPLPFDPAKLWGHERRRAEAFLDAQQWHLLWLIGTLHFALTVDERSPA